MGTCRPEKTCRKKGHPGWNFGNFFYDVELLSPTLVANAVGIFLYRQDCFLVDTIATVPAHTEARIHQLCTEALGAQTQADIERILPELRSALEEHVRLAKTSLEAQVTAITVIDALAFQSQTPD